MNENQKADAAPAKAGRTPKFSVGQRVVTEIGVVAIVMAYRTGLDWDTVTLDNGRDYNPAQLAAAPAQVGHTPGPWKVYGATKQDCKVMDSRGREMAIVRRSIESPEEAEFNARLIAAAPELLDVVKDLIGYVQVKLYNIEPGPATEPCRMAHAHSLRTARAALARAGGDK